MEGQVMNPGEIHLALFPFGEATGAKPRPILMLTGPLGSVPEVLVAYMTTVVPPTLLSTDILIDPKTTAHSSTNLKPVTLLRLHKLATIHDSSVYRLLGQVSAATWSDV